ncbi:MAG: restriction endonuclease subunit S, partial [Ignavibacteria bacterium]|nr:restriction endonuclease subunit S [Ignavibacteria bacterium]
PFEIPTNWIWTKLGEITIITDRDHRTPVYRSKGIPLVSPKIFTKNGINFSWAKFVDDEELRLYRKKCNFQKGDILYSRIGTIGEARIIDFDHDFVALHSIALIKPVDKNVNSNFLCSLLSSNFVKNQAIHNVKSVSVPDLGLEKINNFIVPLPPLAEQSRIVNQVNRLMALCDELEARQQNERAGCLMLGTASLAGLQNAESPEDFGRQWAQVCGAFDLILDCPENVAVLRQTILQMAVQGRLVRQVSGDEPAKKLVERIRSNKSKLIEEGIIKKEKVIESVKTDEELFSLPPGWSWIKLYDLITFGIRNGYSPLPAINTTNTKVLTLSATTRGVFDNRYYKYLSEKIDENSHLWLTEGDILIQRSNTPGYVGISAIYHGDSNLFIYPDMMMKFRLSEEVNSDFIHKAINCGYSRKYFTSKAIGTSSSMKKINQNIVENLIIPLPPLAEQHRIVAKVDALMALCDALESRLKERAGVQGRLANAIVKEIGVGNA